MNELVGRFAERAALDSLLTATRAGDGRALVLRGPSGIGKSALLRYLAGRATDCRVVRSLGVEAEAELSYAGLFQLCHQFLDRLDDLAAPQREALAVAFGLRSGALPDPFVTGLAVLSLLTAAAAEQPLVCLFDDAQWLDRASMRTLSFVSRRVTGGRVSVVFATDLQPPADLPKLPDLVLGGLTDADVRALPEFTALESADRRVRDRIVAECRGNPLALTRALRAMAAELRREPAAVPAALARSLRARLDQLPSATRQLLLIAAAEPTGDPLLLWAAAERLGTGPAAAPAADLVELDGQVRFFDPLARQVIVQAAGEHERRRVHRALAEVTDAPDRRAWHRAEAVAAVDERVADDLERSADAAGERGGLATAAAFLDRAAVLTLDRAARSRRALAAAGAMHRAGQPAAAQRSLATALAGPLDGEDAARSRLLDAQLAGTAERLLRAAADAAPYPRVAHEAHRDALLAAAPAIMPRVAEAIRGAGPGPGLLRGLVLLETDGPATATPMLQAALRAGPGDSEDLALAVRAAVRVWDDEAWADRTDRLIRLCRRQGALPALRDALGDGVAIRLLGGDLAAAGAMAEEAARLADAGAGVGDSLLAAWRGGDPEHAGWAAAMLYNGLGRYEKALTLLAPPAEIVEAAVRTGAHDRAEQALRELTESATAAGTDWALGIQARSRALLATGDRADALYREAVTRLGRTRIRAELARAHLLHGEWLRRNDRRADGRTQLRIAHDLLGRLGLAGFADRAYRELAATGKTGHARRPVVSMTELTAQEERIARLAGGGLSNPEISTQLFISPRTVEWHLRKVFTKLGITSRRELRSRHTLVS